MVCIVTRVVPSGKWKLPIHETVCRERLVARSLNLHGNHYARGR